MPVRQSYLKNICNEIMRTHSDEVTEDFELNKLLVNKITDTYSKKIRNRVAGLLVGLKKNEGRVISPPYRGKIDRRRIRRRE